MFIVQKLELSSSKSAIKLGLLAKNSKSEVLIMIIYYFQEEQMYFASKFFVSMAFLTNVQLHAELYSDLCHLLSCMK